MIPLKGQIDLPSRCGVDAPRLLGLVSPGVLDLELARLFTENVQSGLLDFQTHWPIRISVFSGLAAGGGRRRTRRSGGGRPPRPIAAKFLAAPTPWIGRWGWTVVVVAELYF